MAFSIENLPKSSRKKIFWFFMLCSFFGLVALAFADVKRNIESMSLAEKKDDPGYSAIEDDITNALYQAREKFNFAPVGDSRLPDAPTTSPAASLDIEKIKNILEQNNSTTLAGASTTPAVAPNQTE